MAEVFRRFNDRLEVSDLGNVKKDGKVIKPGHGENYDYVCCGSKQYRVHIMVAEMFPEICGEKKKWYHAHHINRNQRDNRAVNLTWLSRSEHKRVHQLEEGVSKPVKAYSLEGRFIGRWDSIEQAAAATGTDSRHIKNILSGKERRFTANKLYWFPADDSEEKIFQKITNIQHTKYEALKGNQHAKKEK